MADATWVSDTHALPVATLAEATEFRVVDDPAGTPSSKKTSIADIRARLIAAANAWTAAQTLNGTTLGFSGNQSKPAWTTTGAKFLDAPGTLTDTTSSGTVANARTNVLGGDTIAASAATTFTDYYSAFLSQPVAGSNVTLTNRWALGLSGGLKSTGYSLTGSQAQNLLDFSGVWNTSGVPTGFKLDITDTASGSGSKLADFKSSGTTALAIFRNSDKYVAIENAYTLLICSGSRMGGAREISLGGNSTAGIGLGSATPLSWSSSTDVPGGSPDLTLIRDAANVLAQRRTTNAQTFRWYHTFTDPSNRQNGALKTASGYVEIAAETAGTGADDLDVLLTPAGTGNVRFGTHAGVTAELVTGFITIKDAGGTSRKIAVIS